jgi:hypothetical protein
LLSPSKAVFKTSGEEKDTMISQVTATVIGGMLKPDVSLHLPEQTRVRLTVEPISDALPKTTAQEAWQAIKARLRERPIHAAGLHYTRDELHERR